MNDLDAYRFCRWVARRFARYFGACGIDPEDAAHDLYVRWSGRDHTDKASKQRTRIVFDRKDLARNAVGRKDRPKVRPLPFVLPTAGKIPGSLAIQCEHAIARTEDQGVAIHVEEVRQVDGGRFADLVDALLANNFEQKSAAAALGVSAPAVSQRLKTLRRRMAAA